MRKITCDPQGRRERLQRIMRTYSTPSSSSSSSQATTSPSPQKSKRRFWRPWRRQQKKPGTLVLLRHGESHWNLNNSFTGWADPDLTADGCAEVRRAARLLLERGYKPEVIYTSRLKRAIRSSFILLKEMNLMYRPLFKEYELNERMYGALTGMSKSQIALTFGEELVQQWRRSLDVRPPELDEKHPYWPGNERKYNDIPRSKIPKTESLHDTMNRAVPLFKKKIEKDLRDGKDVLVVAHYNSLRGLVKHIDSIDTDEIRSVEIPTGIPLVYEFDVDMKPIRSNFSGQGGMSGSFLATPEVTQAALKRERELSQDVPGFTDSPLVTPVLRAISSLQRERESLFKERKHDASDNGRISIASMLSDDQRGSKLSGELDRINGGRTNIFGDNSEAEGASESSMSKAVKDIGIDEPLLIIMRHGTTEFNKLGLFTGWQDVTLSAEGREEAINAGKLMAKYNVQIDEVHTSCLSRAIETAWLAMGELDAFWVPFKKTWRLNERMYGGLTGLSKKLISQMHGEEQFKKWRRGYDERPPPVDSFSQHYPGNDQRYVEMVTDIPISGWQTLIRSLEAGKLQIARKMPRTESLKDCMRRTIPYFRTDIMKNLYQTKKNTLVVSSENAIRGLLMELCDISEKNITSVEIPTGLPMLYDSKTRSIRLLDDGKGDPLLRYNFGSKPELLFKSEMREIDSRNQSTGNLGSSSLISLPVSRQDLNPELSSFSAYSSSSNSFPSTLSSLASQLSSSLNNKMDRYVPASKLVKTMLDDELPHMLKGGQRRLNLKEEVQWSQALKNKSQNATGAIASPEKRQDSHLQCKVMFHVSHSHCDNLV
eukprot:CAMPEP_0184484750 /NCGR_PEP_ID=MMETSP0113_2-20130426/6426_1 /TAXON_ID=91329 /ORGANISM="Norrisiella sphaerica, Strain BC52" /LENGTH=825 /DNA_ID=CAMNT_0026865871 /DNA_START=476 /DNA_END=2954 /DNA_ORIENTATION=-